MPRLSEKYKVKIKSLYHFDSEHVQNSISRIMCSIRRLAMILSGSYNEKIISLLID
jgi:hypothetical protein